MAQWQVDLQTGSALAVGAVVGSDLSAMHLYDGPAEVQSDARSLDVQVVGVFALVETLEQPVGLLVLESDAAVYDLYDGLFVILAQDDTHLAAVEGVFEGIRQQVGDDLVELDAVYPSLHRQGLAALAVGGRHECEADIALLGIVLIERADARDEGHQVGLGTVQVHLLLVYLALVEYLVHQEQQPLRIAVDGLNVGQALFVCYACSQLVQGSHDEGQRRADVVGGIDQEAHLLLVEVGAPLALQVVDDEGDGCQYQQRVGEVGQGGGIPGSLHHHGDGAGVCRVDAVAHGPHLDDILARFHAVERNAVRAFHQGSPVAVVQPVLIDDVLGVAEVEHRELQRERVLVEGYLKAVAHAAHRFAVDDEVGQVYLAVDVFFVSSHVVGIEGDYALIAAIADAVVFSVHHHAHRVFAGLQSVTVDMADEPLAVLVVLPYSVGRAHPQVAVPRAGDGVYGLVLHLFGTGQQGYLVLLAVVVVESAVGSDEHRAVFLLAECKALLALQLQVPAEDAEIQVGRVHHAYAARTAYPEQSATVQAEGFHPVVAESALLGVDVVHAQRGRLARMGVEHAESFSVVADEERSLSIVGHAVDAPSVHLQPRDAGSRVGVVAVEGVLAAHPVVALLVAVDAVGTCR